MQPTGLRAHKKKKEEKGKAVRTPTAEAMRTQDQRGRTVEEFVLLKAVMKAACCTKSDAR